MYMVCNHRDDGDDRHGGGGHDDDESHELDPFQSTSYKSPATAIQI